MIVKSVNQQPADGAAATWQLVNLLVSQAGYSKIKDSDGTTFSLSGTAVTSAANLANPLAWVLLRLPDSSLYLSIQHSDDSVNTNWRIEVGVATPTGGSATQVPTMSDGQLIAGGGSAASPTFNDVVIGESDGSGYWFNVVATNTAPYAFCAFSWVDPALPNGYVSSLIFLDYIQSWTAVVGDVFPYVLKATSVGSGGDNGNIAALSQPDPGTTRTAPWTWLAKGLGGAGFVLMPMSGRANAITSPQVPGKLPVNPVTSKFDLLPIEYFRDDDAPSNPKGLKGWSTLFSWRPLTAHNTGDLYTVASTKDNIVLSDLVLNLWGGDTPSGTGETPTTRNGRIFTAPTSDSTPPIISNVTPTPGSVIGPNTAWQFDVTDASGLGRCLVKVALGQEWEMPHDGAGFSPRYAAGSTRTVIANGFRYTLVRAGSWPVAPTFEPIAFDTAGNMNA